jgi:heme/copper-type cytochrome/quinol oxidase subunit 3
MNLLTPRDYALRAGVWSVIASEALVFCGLLAMRGAPTELPSSPTIVLAAIVAAALVGGAGALAAAVRRTRLGRVDAASRLLALGGAVGMGALALELGAVRVTGFTDPVAIAIVGLHAAHVAAAIALAMWVLALARCGRLHRRHHDVLQLVTTYWYFVAGVWVLVWPLLTAPRA